MENTQELNDRIFELHAEGFKAGKIAQKLRVKKAVILDILGEADSKGLGDVITEFTEVTGIKKVVEAITDDCGCKARAQELNKLFPSRKLNDLSNEDYSFLESFLEPKRPNSIRIQDQKRLVQIYNDVFNAKRKTTNCAPCLANLLDDLIKVYEGAKQ